MTHAIARAASAYRDAGHHQTAAERFYRAGRSSFGQGDREGSAKFIKDAIEAAEKAGDAPSVNRFRLLLNEIQADYASPAASSSKILMRSFHRTERAGLCILGRVGGA
jgi:hypothetical protein